MVLEQIVVKVLAVRHVRDGLLIAHVEAGGLYGDVPASPGVEAGQQARLVNKLQTRAGRLGASLKVERLT